MTKNVEPRLVSWYRWLEWTVVATVSDVTFHDGVYNEVVEYYVMKKEVFRA